MCDKWTEKELKDLSKDSKVDLKSDSGGGPVDSSDWSDSDIDMG
jgi:hypothetical protein